MSKKKETKSKKPPIPKKADPIMQATKAYDISLQMEIFCRYFTTAGEFYGNGVRSALHAHNLDALDQRQYRMAKTISYSYLSNEKVLKRINDLMEEGGFNDVNADKQLLFLMTQNSDYSSKLGALKEYNKLKQRVLDRMSLQVEEPVAAIRIIPARTREQIKAANPFLKNKTDDSTSTGREA